MNQPGWFVPAGRLLGLFRPALPGVAAFADQRLLAVVADRVDLVRIVVLVAHLTDQLLLQGLAGLEIHALPLEGELLAGGVGRPLELRHVGRVSPDADALELPRLGVEAHHRMPFHGLLAELALEVGHQPEPLSYSPR